MRISNGKKRNGISQEGLRDPAQGRRHHAQAGSPGLTGWLHEQRLDAVRDVIRDRGARSVLDLGCGDGDLLVRIAREGDLDTIVGMDVCSPSLSRLHARLEREAVRRDHVKLLHGSLLDAPSWLRGFDCAVLVETIEHLDAERLGAFENSVLGRLRPDAVVVTTPNAEYNALLGVPAHRFRHPDHRFEWDRARFRGWADGVARRQGYRVGCTDIAGRHPRLGGASQMAVFDVCRDASDRHAA